MVEMMAARMVSNSDEMKVDCWGVQSAGLWDVMLGRMQDEKWDAVLVGLKALMMVAKTDATTVVTMVVL